MRHEYPTIVEVVHKHNHLIQIAEVTKWKDVSDSVKEKFLDLFKHHNPSRALTIHKQDLQEEFDDKYYVAAADRSLCPDLNWVFNFYYAHFNKEFGSSSSRITYELENIVKSCKDKKVKVKFEMTDEENFAIAFSTPLMERVHGLVFLHTLFPSIAAAIWTGITVKYSF